MKKLSKILAMVMAVALVLALAACGGDTNPTPSSNDTTPSTNNTTPSINNTTPSANNDTTPADAQPADTTPAFDWTTFEGWQEENWDAKEIAYQFSGSWELAEYNMNFNILVNLYKDGSAAIDQRNILTSSSYWMYGYWSEENTQDGNEITFDTLYVVDLSGGLAAHEYSYTLYEEADGNYSFAYTFGIAPGSYFRDADMVGGSTVTYATFEDFHAAVDVVLETYRFVSTDANDYNMDIMISVLSDNTATANLMTEYNGATVVANHKDGTLQLLMNEDDASASYTLVIEDVEIPLTQNADGSFADFEYTYAADLMGTAISITTNMTATEPVNETAE